jgi:hypothetical protein
MSKLRTLWVSTNYKNELHTHLFSLFFVPNTPNKSYSCLNSRSGSGHARPNLSLKFVLNIPNVILAKFVILSSKNKSSSQDCSNLPNNLGKSEIDLLLERMFKEAQENLNELTEWVKNNTDRFLVLSTLMAADQVLVHYREKSRFLTLMILDLQARLNKSLNKFVEDQLESIKEYKCSIKRITLVPYVAKFPYFVDRFEDIISNYSEVKTTTRQTADTTYMKLTK